MPAPTIQRYWVMTRHPWPCGWMPYPSPCRDRRAPRGRSRTTGRGEPGGEGSLLTERLPGIAGVEDGIPFAQENVLNERAYSWLVIHDESTRGYCRHQLSSPPRGRPTARLVLSTASRVPGATAAHLWAEASLKSAR